MLFFTPPKKHLKIFQSNEAYKYQNSQQIEYEIENQELEQLAKSTEDGFN